jgi:hypothetical protein
VVSTEFTTKLPNIHNHITNIVLNRGIHYLLSIVFKYEFLLLTPYALTRNMQKCNLNVSGQEAQLLMTDMSNAGRVSIWCRFLPKKLIVIQLVRKFLTHYGTQRFIAMFTKAVWILSSASKIHSAF